MSWIDDLFSFGDDAVDTGAVSDLLPVVYDVGSTVSDTLDNTAGYDWSSLLGDLSSDSVLEYPDSSTIDAGNLLNTGLDTAKSAASQGNSAIDDYLKTLGMDSTPAAFDVGSSLQDNPVATSQVWNMLNTAQNPIYSAALDSNTSSPALLSALTDRSLGYSDNTMGSSFGAGLNTDSGYAPGSVYDTGSGSTFGASLGTDLGSGLDTGKAFNLSSLATPANWLAKLMAKSGQGKKSNLASGIGALAMASQVAGALGSKDKVAPSVTQHGATGMTWNKSAANKGKKLAVGGDVGGGDSGAYPRKPQGALGLLRGNTMGQADKVPINAAHGEYVMDADIVSALGDGNTDAGAAKLDKMRQNIRAHKRSAPSNKIPPKAKEPMAYLKGAK